MFSKFLLISSALADAVGEMECDIPAFVAGAKTSIKEEETVSIDFSNKVGFWPKLPMTQSETLGSLMVAGDGLGAELHLSANAIDLMLMQDVHTDAVRDMVDTIGFTLKIAKGGPDLEFSMDFKGKGSLEGPDKPDGVKQLCFKDSIPKIVGFVEKIAGPPHHRRLHEIATADLPASDEFKPEIEEKDVGTLHTEVVTYHAHEHLFDGTTHYEADKVMFAMTVDKETMMLKEFNMTLTGPDPAFKFQESFEIHNLKHPVEHLTGPPAPGFCGTDAAPWITIAMLEKMEGPIEEAEHEYEDEVIHELETMEPTARRLSSEAAKKKIVVETLKKMHSAQKVFEGYQQEKARLVRKAFIEFSVVGVVAFAVFLAAAVAASEEGRGLVQLA
jgi:hypothetical protein